MTHEEILSMLGDYVDYLIANSSAEAPMWNIEKVRSGKPNKWNYIDGCMITACLSLYKTTGDEKYLEFSKEFIDYFVQPDGAIKTYDPKEYNLDNVNQGKNLFILYDIYGDEKYRKAIDTIRSQLLTQPRTKEGNFWHKDIYPWQVWLDGTYMAQPFYMEYETRFNKMQGCIDSYKQFMNIKKHMRDEKTGLYYHGYDESRQMYWADPETGCSPNFWLRAMGWFLVAMVDVLERMASWPCSNRLWRTCTSSRTSRPGCSGRSSTTRRPRATIWRPVAPPCLPMQCSRACVWAICPNAWLHGRRRPSTAPATGTCPRTRTAACSWTASALWRVWAARITVTALWPTTSASRWSATMPRA